MTVNINLQPIFFVQNLKKKVLCTFQKTSDTSINPIRSHPNLETLCHREAVQQSIMNFKSKIHFVRMSN